MAGRARRTPAICVTLLIAGAGGCLGACESLTSLDYTNAQANPCPEGAILCNDGNCWNLETTLIHCGSCGRVCPGGATCAGGQCVCPQDVTLCTLGCFDLRNDPSNCGACGQSCFGYPCLAGVCQVPDCREPRRLCGTGCVDLSSDVQNCGVCSRRCFGICAAGVCFSEPADASFDVDVQDAGIDADAADADRDSAADANADANRP